MAKGNGKRGRTVLDSIVDNEPREPGTLICAGVVEGRATPWKSPTIAMKPDRQGRLKPTTVRNRDYKSFESWKRTVAATASQCMSRRQPYGGPVEIRVVFYLSPKSGRPPDTCNLLKSLEDSLNGIVYRDDSQVHEETTRRVIDKGERQRVEFEIRAI